MKQLAYTGMLETTRLRREGFPARVPFAEFCAQYAGIAFPFSQRVLGTKERCAEILAAAAAQLPKLGARKHVRLARVLPGGVGER